MTGVGAAWLKTNWGKVVSRVEVVMRWTRLKSQHYEFGSKLTVFKHVDGLVHSFPTGVAIDERSKDRVQKILFTFLCPYIHTQLQISPHIFTRCLMNTPPPYPLAQPDRFERYLS